MGVSVGVEETKEDKRKTAKSEEDEEGEGECTREHTSRNLQQNVQNKRAKKSYTDVRGTS